MISIYKITNTINNKIYIGQTSQQPAIKRFNFHKKVAAGGKDKYPKQFRSLHYAMEKHGINNFIFEIIEECLDKNTANSREIFYIDLYKTNIIKYGAEYGYNMTDGGDGALGSPRSDEAKSKISKALKGKYIGELSHKFGVRLTDEQKVKMSERAAGRKHTEETKQRLRQLNLGENNPSYGIPHKEEHKTLISNALLGDKNHMWNKPVPLEVRQKQSESHKMIENNYTHSEDKLLKIREARRNQDMSYRIPLELKSEVVSLFNSGNFTKKQLSEKFNIKIATIRTIITRANKITLK